MKKVTFLITFIFVVSFLMFSGSLDARLPDLTVKKITVDRKCHLAVVVQNKGPGILPDYVYTKHHPKSAGVYVYINGRGWGGQSIWKFDPQRNLQQPGGVATYISRYVVGATPIQVKAVVDLHNDVKERVETNNSLGHRALRCKPAPSRPKFMIYNIKMSPKSPAYLALKQKVNIKFDYYSSEKVHIFARPFSGASLTPHYAASGSPSAGYPAGKGNGSGYFMITKGKGVIDKVRFQMTNMSQTKVLFEKFVPVRYKFPKAKKLWITISGISQIHFWSSGGGTEELGIGGSGFGSSIGIKRVQVGPISLDASSVEEWLPDHIIMALPHVFPYAQTHNVYIKQSGVIISNIVSIFIKMDVTELFPMAGSPGSTIQIGGIGFGATQGSLKVKFGTTEATVVSWADQMIQVVVPSIPPGSYPVYIEKNNTQVSTDKPFTI